MRRLIFFIIAVGLAFVLALSGTSGTATPRHDASVQAQEPSGVNGYVLYLPLIRNSPSATITTVVVSPTSPASAAIHYVHQIGVDITVRTNISGALETTLYEGSTPRDIACQMISQPGTWTHNFALDVMETGSVGIKNYVVEARFKLGAASCQATGLYPDAAANQSYQVNWQLAPPPGTQLLVNGSFEDENWDSYWMGTGNQQPADWNLSWIQPGQPLYDASELAAAEPECVHKYYDQLPEDEQLGKPGALILDGQLTYKIFWTASFGGELRQTVSGLLPGLPVKLEVPILLVRRDGDNDPWSSESGVWLNGTGTWANAATMGHRNWYTHTVETVVPQDGRLEVVIRVKSKWAGADFFIDAVRLETR